ncbi:helix-turn-helix domain-containing protein [Eggerthella lenta]|uniref:helix-turn-helix domain-containing protein n=1 Tax=Eggerthella lenta TaxID=84112 RepID=UPI001F4516DB|nr:helix-turn-helix transcriptional regulator [Eggerthella lenta]MDU8005769.1 helix-turn-helix transcriptional regulator [Eggerthella sp.]
MGDSGDIYARMEQLRQIRGISIAELSRRIDADKKRLWYVLHGQREMRVDEFLKLCMALRVDPRSFVNRKMVEEIEKRVFPDR